MIALEINVKDTGIGISKEARQRLFQFFSQAEISTNRKYGGTGLGLAITKRLVEMQGGTVQVSSEPGAGTTFTVQLVYHQVENDANQQKEKEDLEGLRLMLVDDSQVSRAVIHTYLNEAGAVVTEVPGGVEALKLLLAMEPHKLPQIILTDYQMPDLDGLELGIQVKGTPSLEKIPLVMITSATLAAKVAAIKNHPFEGFLYKPVRKSELVDMMTKIAGKKQLRKHLQGIKDIEKAGLSNASRGRLLLVEDLPSNQKLAIITLGRMGYQVEMAENGLIALEKCQTTTYDAILMDCQMPVMDGYEASWRIRTEGGPNAHTPIIAMTANAMEGERQKCLEAGMNDYVTKPFRRKPLEEVLTHYMKKGDR